MAVLLVDSFDHYTTAQITRKHSAAIGAVIDTAVKRTGRASMDINLFDVLVPSHPATCICGFAFRADVEASNEGTILNFMGGGFNHFLLKHMIVGGVAVFQLVKHEGTIIATSTSHHVLLGDWHYIEVKALIHSTDGTFSMRVDGVAVTWDATMTSLVTRGLGPAYVDQVRIRKAEFAQAWIDDLYIADTSGGVNDNFLGAVTVQCLLPDTDGTLVDWASSGVGQAAMVDDETPDDDTTYLESSTSGEKFSNRVPLLGTTGTVKAVQVVSCAKRTGGAGPDIKNIVRNSGGTLSEGSSITPETSGYNFHPSVFNTAPGSVAWTPALVNTSQYGAEVP